jgi:hypothetical protein
MVKLADDASKGGRVSEMTAMTWMVGGSQAFGTAA